jgi:arginine exporter protein ArgO
MKGVYYMHQYFIQGFLLGLAYVAPIGMQNLYVINTAVRMNRLRAFQVALITIFFDISLALACFFGIGILLDKISFLKYIFLLVGSLSVIYIGITLIRSKPKLNDKIKVDEPVLKIAGICFAVTWLNPQAIIDGTANVYSGERWDDSGDKDGGGYSNVVGCRDSDITSTGIKPAVPAESGAVGISPWRYY